MHKVLIDQIVSLLQKRIVELNAATNTDFNLYCSGFLLQNEAVIGELTSNVLELTVSLPGGKYKSLCTLHLSLYGNTYK